MEDQIDRIRSVQLLDVWVPAAHLHYCHMVVVVAITTIRGVLAILFMTTRTPIPFLTLPTAVVHLLALTATLHDIVRDKLLRHATSLADNLITRVVRPSQILFRFLLTERRLGRWRIPTKLGVQTHNIVAIFLTSLTAVMKVPTLFAAKGMRTIGRLDIGTGRSTALWKVPPTLRSLVFGIPHKAYTKELALHGIASVS